MKSDKLTEILNAEPNYRREQVWRAWFDPAIKNYADISTLPKNLRVALQDLPYLTVKEKKLQISKTDETKKVLLELSDGEVIESVLMGRENKKDTRTGNWRYTICISTQVGCPMGCVFCSTAECGFTRNLTAEEIIDQYRFWQNRLGQTGLIDNVVLMGQGEPLLNYDNVKEALRILLKYAELGPRKITLSTVGVPAAMDRLVEDKDFPQVRLALSLHSAIEATRKKIVPSHQPGFLEWLPDWAKRYHRAIPSRVHFLGLEYTLLAGINDDAKHLKALKNLASKLGRVRLNLIPYNFNTRQLRGSSETVIKQWHEELMAAGFVCTIRRSQGQDIAAACGQLKNITVL